MKKTIFLLVSVLALSGGARPAAARGFWECMIEAVRECDRQFPPGDFRNAAIRGWCYMVTQGICMAE